MQVVPEKGLVTDEWLAVALDVQRDTVQRWEKEGLPVHRVGNTRMYDLAAFHKWVKRQPATRRAA